MSYNYYFKKPGTIGITNRILQDSRAEVVKAHKTVTVPRQLGQMGSLCTGCIGESGEFATLFFLVQQHWGGCRYHHFAANFKAF
jgi:hypothetical protein